MKRIFSENEQRGLYQFMTKLIIVFHKHFEVFCVFFREIIMKCVCVYFAKWRLRTIADFYCGLDARGLTAGRLGTGLVTLGRFGGVIGRRVGLTGIGRRVGRGLGVTKIWPLVTLLLLSGT